MATVSSARGSTDVASLGSSSIGAGNVGDGLDEFVTMWIAGQMFAIPVSAVRDVLGPQRITRIPLAPAEIAGSLNLRGRIVTAIDLRIRLGLPPSEVQGERMSVVVDHSGELYSLLVDQVGEVLRLGASTYERKPPALDPRWAEVTTGVHRLSETLLLVIDVECLRGFVSAA